MFTGYFPKFTLSSGKSDDRHGDGLAMICNGQTMLVDGFEGGEPTKRVITWLKSNGVKKIDVAVLTHYHYDHYNGLLQIEADPDLHIDLVYCYDPRTLLHGVDNSSNGKAVKEDIANAYAWIRKMQSYGTRVKWIDRGDVLKFGDITWRIYRDQPKVFTDLDDGNAYAFVNDGSLILWSPEIELLLGGDGPEDLENAIRWFGAKVSGYDVSHHGNNCSRHNALALKSAGCVVAWQSCIERSGAGTTGWTEYGSRRVKQQGVPVWQQDQDILITAGAGKIIFTQGSKSIAKDIPYHGEIKEGWVHNAKGWWYRYKDGSWAVGWAKLRWSKGENWFFFDSRGYMVTGWHYLTVNNAAHWFYFDKTSGAMRTGWIYDGGLWYYLDPENGAMHTGWIDWKGRKCYLEPVSGKVQGHAYRNEVAVIDGRSYSFDNDCYATEISAAGSTSVVKPGTKVIDISEFQPENINWSKIKAGGYAVIVRIGLRGSIPNTERYRKVGYDHHFKTYINGIIAAGIPYSVYFFPTPMSDAEADQEADWIVMNISGLKLSMPLWLDSEKVPGGVANDISTADRTRYLKRITDKLVAAGIPCGIYASTSWLQHQISMSQLQQQVQDNTWCAQYNTKCTYDGIYAMWQYSSKANVDGINGNVDISEVKRSFNMSCQKTETKTEDGLDKDNVRIFPTTDPVKISNSGSDEHGNYKGGAAGDNTGREWYIRDWYNRPWNCVLRHPDPAVRACIADLATKAANNNKIGYDQYQRETYWQELQKVGYDPAKITTACEADCSAGVIANIKAAGHLLGHKELQDITCTYTGNMRSGLKAAGFACLTDSKYINGSSYLVAGDILLNDAHHTATAVTNGINSGNGSVTPASMPLIKKGSKGSAVLRLQKILNSKGCKLEEDSDFGPATEAAVKAFQKANHLENDGEVGPLTWAALLK